MRRRSTFRCFDRLTPAHLCCCDLWQNENNSYSRLGRCQSSAANDTWPINERTNTLGDLTKRNEAVRTPILSELNVYNVTCYRWYSKCIPNNLVYNLPHRIKQIIIVEKKTKSKIVEYKRTFYTEFMKRAFSNQIRCHTSLLLVCIGHKSMQAISCNFNLWLF